MSRPRRPLLVVPVLAAAVGLAACGSKTVELAKDDPNYRGAMLFAQRCSGCHTMDVAGTEGSASSIGSRENKDGPNFNERVESAEDVLYAIRNGGYSSGPMPQNIVTGEDAEAVAEFVAKYSGRKAQRPPDPQGGNPNAPPSAAPPEETQ